MTRPGAATGAERFAARSRRRRLRRLLLSLCGVLAGFAAGAVLWLLGWSDVTAVDGVDVDGADGRVERAVRGAADVPGGIPLIRVDTGSIAERVRAVPDVAEVEVRRGWPRTVEIEVAVREAAATLEDDGRWWSIDREGVVFGPSEERDFGRVEVVADGGDDPEQVGARVAAIEVIEDLPAEVTELLAAVEARSAAAIELVLTDGRHVQWGTASEAARKAEVLAVLMAEVPDASEYDVSAPDFPTATE